jgi:tetratricopeptide (TPR) repeat protein
MAGFQIPIETKIAFLENVVIHFFAFFGEQLVPPQTRKEWMTESAGNNNYGGHLNRLILSTNFINSLQEAKAELEKAEAKAELKEAKAEDAALKEAKAELQKAIAAFEKAEAKFNEDRALLLQLAGTYLQSLSHFLMNVESILLVLFSFSLIIICRSSSTTTPSNHTRSLSLRNYCHLQSCFRFLW